MCTAATYKTDGFYFGRTLDYEFSYGDEIVVTPRRFPLAFSGGKALSGHFALLGMAVVVGLTLLRGSSALGSVSFASLSPLSLLYIFLSGAVAITAMVLLGILGSSILLIAGVYLPAIQAVRSFLHMELSVLPGLFALGFGVLAGVALSIHAIRTALHKYRSEMVWLILGLMLGSLYAIVYGAVNLTVPLPPMSLVTFDAPAPLLAGQQRAAAHR